MHQNRRLIVNLLRLTKTFVSLFYRANVLAFITGHSPKNLKRGEYDESFN